MVSVVNGYTCFSSCDEAKARQGKDPHPSDPLSSDPTAAKKSALDGQPATILDGVLKELATAIDPANAANGTASTALQQPSINILA